jgi:hypothetical protein
MPAYEYVQLSDEAWAALTGEKVAHILVINEIEKLLVPPHLGYVDKVVKAIMPEFPTRRLGEVEVHWQTQADDPELAWRFLEAKKVTDKKQFQIAQKLFDAGYGATCLCVAIRRKAPVLY